MSPQQPSGQRNSSTAEVQPRKNSEDTVVALPSQSSDDVGSVNGAGIDPSAESKNQPDTSPNQEPEWAHGFQLLSILTAVTLVLFLMLLDGTIIVAAIPRITDDFKSLKDIGWYGAAYQLGSAVFQPLTGKIYMQFKPKWTYLSFFIVFEIGSLICGLANSSAMLIGGRLVAGLGTSGMLNGTFIIIAECVPMQRRPTITGSILASWSTFAFVCSHTLIDVSVAQLGLASGPLFGGLLTEFSTWRWCFYLNLPIGGVVALMLVFVRVPQQHPRLPPMSVIRTLHTSLDLIGFLIFAPALTMLLLALQLGGSTYAWNSSQIIGLFCGTGATFIVFLSWNYHKGDAAMLPVSIAGKRNVWTSCAVYGLLSGNVFTGSYWIAVYFQGVRDLTPTMSGVYMLPMIIAHIVSGLSSGPIVARLGYYIPVSLVTAIFMTVGSGLVATFSTTTSIGELIGYQIILGVGRGLGIQMPILAVQNTVTPSQLPIAMALVMFSQSFGAAVFLSFAETIFSNSFATLTSQYAPTVDSQSIIDAGATGFRVLVSGTDLIGVLVAFAQSINRVFYLAAGMGFGCLIFAWGMGWKDLRKKIKA